MIRLLVDTEGVPAGRVFGDIEHRLRRLYPRGHHAGCPVWEEDRAFVDWPDVSAANWRSRVLGVIYAEIDNERHVSGASNDWTVAVLKELAKKIEALEWR